MTATHSVENTHPTISGVFAVKSTHRLGYLRFFNVILLHDIYYCIRESAQDPGIGNNPARRCINNNVVEAERQLLQRGSKSLSVNVIVPLIGAGRRNKFKSRAGNIPEAIRYPDLGIFKVSP